MESAGVVCMVCVVLVLLVYSSVISYFYFKDSNPTLPTLKNAPEVISVTTSYVWVSWHLNYNGNGPVCGSTVYLQNPSSTSWTSVGFVPVEEDANFYQFAIDRLDAGTSYGISVRLLHCSGKEGTSSPELSASTQNYVLPSLHQHPSTIASGTTYATVLWQDEYVGDGPTCGYAIDRRGLGDDATPWTTAGLVPLQPGPQSVEQSVFNLTGLEPSMGYQVSVRPILCDGTRIIQLGEGPLLSLRTSTIEPPTLTMAPVLTNLSTSHAEIEWTSDHHGDGPICGYDINLKKHVGDNNEPWLSVGFVPVGNELEFYIGQLEADTGYLVAVSVINCLSGGEGPRRPALSFRTIAPVTEAITVTSHTVSPADGTDMTEIPPATATSACPIIPEVNCTECLQNTTLSMPVYGECHDWKLAFVVALPSLLFLLGLLVLSYIRLKRRSKDSLGTTEINASPCTVTTVQAPRNVYVERNDIENSYEEIEQKDLHIQLYHREEIV
ncbi:twitchin-like isoform X2 [Lytechinus variegatus]|uniref:twitchin-like isoform X2 n=1 Tax=Lytechinus variegatus TaxID=7654 RepID=UPI001BB2B259|nr:twitchin-like isoform X2 [Lytechinus variegatus]